MQLSDYCNQARPCVHLYMYCNAIMYCTVPVRAPAQARGIGLFSTVPCCWTLMYYMLLVHGTGEKSSANNSRVVEKFLEVVSLDSLLCCFI